MNKYVVSSRENDTAAARAPGEKTKRRFGYYFIFRKGGANKMYPAIVLPEKKV